MTVYIHHDAAAAEDQRKGAKDDDEPVLAFVILPLVLQPELHELQLVPVLLRLVRLDTEIIVERDVQHAADRADGVNAGCLRRAGQAAADCPHGDVGFVGNLLVCLSSSLLILNFLFSSFVPIPFNLLKYIFDISGTYNIAEYSPAIITKIIGLCILNTSSAVNIFLEIKLILLLLLSYLIFVLLLSP